MAQFSHDAFLWKSDFHRFHHSLTVSSLSDFLHNSFECVRFLQSESGKNLAVKSNIFLLESSYKLAVCKPQWTKGGIQADVPEPAEISFLVASVSEGVCAGVHYRFVGGALFGLSGMAITLRHAKNVSSGFQRVYSLFNSSHKINILIYESCE